MITTLIDKFDRIGARLKVAADARAFALDIRDDRRGEFFELRRPAADAAEIAVLDVRVPERHLLLLSRTADGKSKFLCGFDERHWFVAAIPEAAPVGTVRQAKEALKPAEVRAAEARVGVPRDRDRRKTAAFVRQGEWFFLPDPAFTPAGRPMLRDEPLVRGGGRGGKPHWVEWCCRVGGEAVWVCSHRPSGVTEAEYRQLLQTRPKAARWNWRAMRRNAGVFVTGRVRHADHATVVLHGWHRVVMNTENQAAAMRHVAFLD